MTTLITPTRNRPHAFSLLEKYIASQTYNGPLKWIVVCDGGADEYRFTQGQQVIIRDPSNDKRHSLCENYLAAIPHIEGSAICLEDDDWYAPSYLSTIIDGLKEAPLAGFAPSFYFHVLSRKWRDMRNLTYCSLACTAFAPEVIGTFQQGCLLGGVYVDSFLWIHWPITLERSSVILRNPIEDPLQVGIKGMLEYPGAGLGHDPKAGSVDWDYRQLRQWLGASAANYMPIEKGPELPCPGA